MRQRDSAKRDEELALVVEWLHRRARLLEEAAIGVSSLGDVDATIRAPVVASMQAEAEGLRRAAQRLETGEHRA
jgi:hypothetical protein